ncbi:hypothetical protein BASA81_001612 [Batrachochytrium salamandrivorans]|nr:hypothetical protein BASA81_001612 [Batrachochytrium salamandrivorans]
MSLTDEELVLAMIKWERKRQRPTNRIISGGASGADFEWSLAAAQARLEVEIMSFSGHARRVPAGCVVQELSEAMLREVDQELEAVARGLNRKLPRPGYTRNLLRRNIHIVKHAKAVYAITELSKSGISGGTAWGCKYHAMFSPSPQLFVFDMATNKWMSYRDSMWAEQVPHSPQEFTDCALIGSRELSEKGKDAIHSLFNL